MPWQIFLPIIDPPVQLRVFYIMENMLIGYADDFTLIAVVSLPGVRVTVAESLSCELVKVTKWCDLWGDEIECW